MKNILLLSLLIGAILLSSCGKKKNSDIIGEWTVSDISSTQKIPDSLKAMYDESIKEMKSSYLLVIKADSTFEHTISETTNKGKWKLSPDSKQLTLTYSNGESETSAIDELTADKLVTSIKVNESKNTISFVKKKKQ